MALGCLENAKLGQLVCVIGSIMLRRESYVLKEIKGLYASSSIKLKKI